MGRSIAGNSRVSPMTFKAVLAVVNQKMYVMGHFHHLRPRIAVAGLLLVLFGLAIGVMRHEFVQANLDRSLVIAVEHDDTAAAVSLLDQGANPNTTELSENQSSLWQLLWDRLRGKSPNAPLARPPLLMIAAGTISSTTYAYNNVPIARALLEHGANVNAHSRGGLTALLIAAENDNADMMRLLLAHGANPNAKADDGLTPLLCIVYPMDIGMAEALLAKGADPNEQGYDGATPLIATVWKEGTYEIGPMSTSGPPKIVRLQPQALHARIVQMVRLLLAHGAEPNHTDKQRHNPLRDAKRFRAGDIVQMLRKHGAR